MVLKMTQSGFQGLRQMGVHLTLLTVPTRHHHPRYYHPHLPPVNLMPAVSKEVWSHNGSQSRLSCWSRIQIAIPTRMLSGTHILHTETHFRPPGPLQGGQTLKRIEERISSRLGVTPGCMYGYGYLSPSIGGHGTHGPTTTHRPIGSIGCRTHRGHTSTM